MYAHLTELTTTTHYPRQIVNDTYLHNIKILKRKNISIVSCNNYHIVHLEQQATYATYTVIINSY